MGDDLLGGGLDIEGWSYLKFESGRNLTELLDKSYTHRQQIPLIIKSPMSQAQHRDIHEVVINALELKTQIDPAWIGK